MSKQAEIDYFENMTDEAMQFVRSKPFSADQRGPYLIDIGQIMTLLPPPPARLIDLGCGSGWTTAMYAKSGYEALGVDIAPAGVTLARETFGGTGARFEVHDFENMPFDGKFDAAVIYDCLHHAEDPLAVLRATHRALSPTGEVVIVEPGRGHHDSPTSKWAREEHGTTENDMPPRLVVRLLRSAQFSTIKVFPRAQFQLVEKTGSGVIIRILRPLLGFRLAAMAKTMKNSIFINENGVVWAQKSSNRGSQPAK